MDACIYALSIKMRSLPFILFILLILGNPCCLSPPVERQAEPNCAGCSNRNGKMPQAQSPGQSRKSGHKEDKPRTLTKSAGMLLHSGCGISAWMMGQRMVKQYEE
eukprot:1155531-Pelagomonas_calceolata.AAC.2